MTDARVPLRHFPMHETEVLSPPNELRDAALSEAQRLAQAAYGCAVSCLIRSLDH